MCFCYNDAFLLGLEELLNYILIIFVKSIISIAAVLFFFLLFLSVSTHETLAAERPAGQVVDFSLSIIMLCFNDRMVIISCCRSRCFNLFYSYLVRLVYLRTLNIHLVNHTCKHNTFIFYVFGIQLKHWPQFIMHLPPQCSDLSHS